MDIKYGRIPGVGYPYSLDGTVLVRCFAIGRG
jgi:hypothetical protein